MNKLIFDFGLGKGDDTDFYLSKGYTVVGVEPNPNLIDGLTKRFWVAGKEGRFVLVNKAIFDKEGETEFYMNEDIYDWWGSCIKEVAEYDGGKSHSIKVSTTSLLELCKEYGTPYYLKVDIEGSGNFVARELFELEHKPKFVSFETLWSTFGEVFSWLYVSGYRKFQLVNQLVNQDRKPKNYKFSLFSSGFFGDDLPDDKWISYEELLSRYMKYRELRILDKEELSLGWLDVHATF